MGSQLVLGFGVPWEVFSLLANFVFVSLLNHGRVDRRHRGLPEHFCDCWAPRVLFGPGTSSLIAVPVVSFVVYPITPPQLISYLDLF